MSVKTAVYITVFVLSVAMMVTLLVYWNIFIIGDYHTIRSLLGDRAAPAARGRWTILTLGIVFFTFLIVILSVFFANLLRGNRFKQQQKDFVNMMTHELKLPVSTILIFAQTLLRKDLSEADHGRFVQGIIDGCERMNMLVNQLLRSQEIDRGRLPLDLRRVRIDQFLQGFAASWPRPLALGPLSESEARIDPTLLEFALANLVQNAEKYGKAAPLLFMEGEEGEVVISVRDEGNPIDRKYAKKIFRRFFRIPGRETRRRPGVGLGLYIVKSIVRLHRGQVRLRHAAEPPGNIFSLILPRHNRSRSAEKGRAMRRGGP